MTAELHPVHWQWTPGDLQGLQPRVGYRYEITDGDLIVTPPPGVAHQVVTDNHARWLREARQRAGERVVQGAGIAVAAIAATGVGTRHLRGSAGAHRFRLPPGRGRPDVDRLARPGFTNR